MSLKNSPENKLIPFPECTVIFDNECMLCNSAVQFLFKHDKKKLLWFVSNKSEKVKSLCSPTLTFHTILFYKSGIFYRESTAVLKIMSLIEFPYSLLYTFIIIPSPLRNFIYKIISRLRHKIKLKSSTHCELNSQLKSRILA